MGTLTHIDARGSAVMVDTTGKKATVREAVASGVVSMKPATLTQVLREGVEKGDVFAVARVAGIMAAKKTGELIPLCHPLSLNSVLIDFSVNRKKGEITVTCTARIEDKTGVEMEAMTGAALACLAIYDMCKALDKGIEIRHIVLRKKTGGKSGTYLREEPHARR